jgi:hypothetical protein
MSHRQFLSGITAKSILDELQSKQPRDKGSERIESQRALKTLSTEYTPIRVSIGARFQPLYLTQTEVSHILRLSICVKPDHHRSNLTLRVEVESDHSQATSPRPKFAK